MTSFSEVKPTSDARRPKHQPGEKDLPLDSSLGSGRDSDRPTEWANRAWLAVERSLARCPYPLGCIDPHSPLHSQWEENRREFVDLYAKRLKAGTAIKWLKFHTSYCFAKSYSQDELPTVPGEFEENERPGRFIGKVLGRALQTVMARGSAGCWAARRCALDVLMSKIGFPPATQEFVDESLKDHEKVLTTPRSLETTPAQDFRRSQVESKILEIVRKIFHGQHFTHRDILPSLRASINGCRKEGGAFGELMRGFELPHRLPGTILVSMGYAPHDGVFEFRLPDVGDVVCQFQDYVDDVWQSRLLTRLEAQPLPILEPLKVRIITKGKAAEYYRCLELQRLMHRRMRQFPVFSYMGQPISDADFGEAFGCRDDLKEGEFYVSGDYKSATDNLDPGLSEFAWSAICAQVRVWWEGQSVFLIDTPYHDLGLKALTQHELFYSVPGKGHLFYHKPQEWGQLMGSPMSFPILCLVNAAATLAALDRPFKGSDALRINGDDIGFIANKETYERWKLVTSECGLQFSMGKNYTSRDFLIINSELRRPPSNRFEAVQVPTGNMLLYTVPALDKDSPFREAEKIAPEMETIVRPASWKLEGFLNQSLLFHTERKGVEAGHQKDVYWTDLEDLSHEVLRGIRGSDQMKVIKLFLNAHHSILEEMPHYVNLWFPRRLGGAGVAIPEGHTLEDLSSKGRSEDLLDKQRRQAAFLSCFPERRLKFVRTPSNLSTGFEEALRAIREISDRQVRPRLAKLESGMFPGDRPKIEGTFMVGLAIEALYDLCIWEQDFDVGELPDQCSPALHKIKNDLLSRRYLNWTRKGLAHSLQPMSYQGLSSFNETSTYVSYIDTIKTTHPADRAIDQDEVYNVLVALMN